MTSLDIRQLTPTIGAEVLGIDLGADLTQEGYAAVRSALLDHQVIFFRDQDISIEAHKALGRRFGTLHVHPQGLKGDMAEHPDVLVIHADAGTKKIAGDRWHSDVSCDPEPPMASILRLHTVPENGGDTLFVSMYAAYDALSAPMKRYLEGLTATHDGAAQYLERAAVDGFDVAGKTFPRASHPVVRTHPETGRKALFVNPVFTQRIDGIPAEESKAVLEFLYRHATEPRFQCRFRWRPHSIAFWDNRCTMHHAMWDYFPGVRSGYRVTIQGDRPF